VIDASRFAEIKSLYAQICDLSAAERVQALQSASADPAVIAEVLRLCAVNPPTELFARPAREAMAELRSRPLARGDVLGAWTLAVEIGQGGMGRVFKAVRSDGHFEQTAAVKVLADMSSAAALEFLASERQILATLVHPNIARLLDGGNTAQGHPYLVMDFVDGVTIDRHCLERALTQSEVLRLYTEVCAAVGYAHRQLVVHCDLKPSNILVGTSGRPVLLDFGVSRMLGDAHRALACDATPPSAAVTSAGYTRRYASPEQLSQARVGTASDIYSLGVMLAELLGVPLADGQPLALDGLPRDLRALLECATATLPAARYASAEDLAEDIRRYLAHLPLQARAPSPGYLAGRWLRRQWPLALAGVLLVVTVTGFAARMRAERDSAQQAERAALAVKDYMVSVFQGADPEVSGQRDLPVSVLLDAGRDKLATDLKDQPAVRAEIGGILGSVYQNIGQREKALKMFDEALAIEGRNQRPLLLAQLLYKKAHTLYDSEDFPRARPIAEDALARIEALAPNSIDHVESLRLLGGILNYAGLADQAAPYLERALEMAKRIAGADSIAAARVHLDLARLHIFHEPSPIAAVPHARQALRAIKKDHYLYADALEIAANALGNTNQLQEALPLVRESADRRIALYGEVSNQAGYSLYTYAYLLARAGSRLDAIAILKRCVHIQEQLDGGAALASETPITLLAQVLEQSGALDTAWERLQQSRAIRTRLLPEAEHDLANLDFVAGRILRLQGQLDAAERISGTVLRQRQTDPGTHPFRLMQSQLEMAALLRVQGKLDAAETQILAIKPAAFAGKPWQQGFLDLELARITALRGDIKSAIAQSLLAEAKLSGGLGAEHPDVWLNRIDRAEWLAVDAQPAAARALAAQIAVTAAASIADNGYWAKRLAAIN